MNIFQKITHLFSKKKQLQTAGNPLIEGGQMLLKDFSFLNTDDRIRKIIVTGDTGNLADFHLMQYAILNDADINVKLAALKRIHLFAAHPDVLPMMKALQKTKPGNETEPYFSMALSRLGLISIEEFEQKMNGVE